MKGKLAQAQEVFVPSIAIGELYYGAWKSQQAQENLNRIDELVGESAVLGCGVEAARRYGEIENALRVKGRPIPENDLWIVAIAVEHRLTLATRGTHSDEVTILETGAW